MDQWIPEKWIQEIANEPFNCKNSMMGFHKLLLTVDEHKALTDALKENEILKEEVERLKLLINPRLQLPLSTTSSGAASLRWSLS